MFMITSCEAGMSLGGRCAHHFSIRMIMDGGPSLYSSLGNGEVRDAMLEDERSATDLGLVEA
ncbi:hypothetical protein DK427_00365 [Methylobacterium radiodurans]|uniref:Uncharacterized protein n=1 Tax=Methylobacterium radiodurans TaxID=2202828 RepID=A0A2U8VL66_9HYPH|nr:hypothetical protein DK427_00365 [Methylobacterium radiodurans]